MKKSITIITEEKNKRQDPCKKIKKVSAGYAFNYLIPKKIAKIATEGEIRHLNMLQEKISGKQDAAYSQKIKLQERLKKIKSLVIRRKCSRNQLIFGSISGQDVSSRVLQLTGESVSKNQITIIHNKKLGKHYAELSLEEGIEAIVILYIVPKTI